MPNPPATIEASLSTAKAAEAKRTTSKLVAGLVDDKESRDDKRPNEDNSEKTVKRVEEVLAAISKQQRWRGKGNRSANQYSNYK